MAHIETFPTIAMPRTPLALFAECLAIFTCLAAFTGCETTESVGSNTRAVVAVPKAAFYKYGPAQTFGPDFLLSQDTKVTVLKRDWAFTRVLTDDGTAGYIASEDLRAAPPEPPRPPPSSAPSVAGRTRTVSSGKPRRSDVESTPGSPLFDMSDLPAMPTESDPPEKPHKPSPLFRF